MSLITADCTIVFPTLENIGFAVGIASISQLLAKLQVLPVYACFLAAILKIVMMSMSRISVYCPFVFSALENMGFAVGIVLISQLFAKLPVFPFFFSFPAAMLDFPLMSMSRICGDYTFVFGFERPFQRCTMAS
jgi:hypothetical protein